MHNYINYAALVLFYHCSYQLPTKWLTFLLPQITFGPFFPTLGHVQLKEHIYSATGTNQFPSKSQNSPLRPSMQSYMVRCHIYPLLPPPKKIHFHENDWKNHFHGFIGFMCVVRISLQKAHCTFWAFWKKNNVGKVFSIAKYANTWGLCTVIEHWIYLTIFHTTKFILQLFSHLLQRKHMPFHSDGDVRLKFVWKRLNFEHLVANLPKLFNNLPS